MIKLHSTQLSALLTLPALALSLMAGPAVFAGVPDLKDAEGALRSGPLFTVQYAIPDAADPVYPDAQKAEEKAEAKDDEAETKEAVADPDALDNAPPAEEAAAMETADEEEADSKTAGCQKAINTILTGQPIEFLSGRYTMSAEGRKKVGRIADLMKGCDEAKAVIGGHTDSDGTPEVNQRLSGQRAEQVMELLVKLGVKAKRLRAVGHGQVKPIVENDTPENKALNRRIEIDLY